MGINNFFSVHRVGLITYWSTSRFIQNHIRFLQSYDPWSPVNLIASKIDLKYNIIISWLYKNKNAISISEKHSTLPRKTLGMHVHSQISSWFNKLIHISNTESFLGFSYSFSFDGSSFLQNQWFCYFFENSNMLCSSSRRRLRRYKSEIYSSKLNQICNKPSQNKTRAYLD